MYKVLVLLAMSLSFVFLTGCKKSPERRAEKVVSKITRHLDLTEVQEVKLNEIKEKYLEVRSNLKKNSVVIEKAKSLILSDQLDSREVQSLMKEKQRRSQIYYNELFPLIKEFHSSLSKDQKEDVISFMTKIHKHFN